MYLKKSIIAIMFLISFYALQAHNQKVHQYIVIEAYKLLKMQLSLEEGIGDIENWIGEVGDNASKWSEINSIAGGSSHEDDYDAVYGYAYLKENNSDIIINYYLDHNFVKLYTFLGKRI